MTNGNHSTATSRDHTHTITTDGGRSDNPKHTHTSTTDGGTDDHPRHTPTITTDGGRDDHLRHTSASTTAADREGGDRPRRLKEEVDSSATATLSRLSPEVGTRKNVAMTLERAKLQLNVSSSIKQRQTTVTSSSDSEEVTLTEQKVTGSAEKCIIIIHHYNCQ